MEAHLSSTTTWRPEHGPRVVVADSTRLVDEVQTLRDVNARGTVLLHGTRRVALVIRVPDGWIVKASDWARKTPDGPAWAIARRSDADRKRLFSIEPTPQYPGYWYQAANLISSATEVARFAWDWVHGEACEGFECDARTKVRYGDLDAALAQFPHWPSANREFIKSTLDNLSHDRIQVADGEQVIRMHLPEFGHVVSIAEHRIVRFFGVGGKKVKIDVPERPEN